MNFDIQNLINKGIDFGGKLVLAAIVFFVGSWLIGRAVGFISQQMKRAKIDDDVRPFLVSMISIGLKVMLLLSVAGIIGIETTSFVAVIAAAGFAVGLALQGSLSNFAGGVLILIFKPFRRGDLIKAMGFTGRVEEIQILTTILSTLDNRTIILPNGPLASAPIENVSAKGTVRVEMTFGVGSRNNIDKVRSIAMEVINRTPKALKGGAHDVVVTKLEALSMNVDVRVWANEPDYWDVWGFVHEELKKAFDANGIVGPQPNTEVVILNK